MVNRNIELMVRVEKATHGGVFVELTVSRIGIMSGTMTSQKSKDAWVEAAVEEVSSIARKEILDAIWEVEDG